MAAYFVLVADKMIAAIMIMKRAKRVISMGEKRDSRQNCVAEPEGHVLRKN
jgi:hypothetical protein